MDEKQWHKKNEKGGIFLLKITIIATMFLPAFLLKFILYIVTFFYYIFSPKERKNIQDYRNNLIEYFGNDIKDKLYKTSTFNNFLDFAESICDKIGVWKGKIKYEDLVFKNKSFIYNELYKNKENLIGHILIVSHFGNIEICRAITNSIDEIDIINLVYTKNSQNFTSIINSIAKSKLKTYEVDDLSVDKMIELNEFIKQGSNLGIMADRISIHDTKTILVKFLGKECYLPMGAFILAGLFKCPVSTLWCEKINGKYCIELEKITDQVILSRNKEESVRPYIEKYLEILEKHVKNNHTQWFNFFNFWKK